MEEWRGELPGRTNDRQRQVRDASARYADRQFGLGMIRVALWVPQEHVGELRAHARLLAKRRPAPSPQKTPHSASEG